MNKVHLLGANRSYDRDVQTVSVNQVVVLDSYDSYVVYEVTRDKWGICLLYTSLRTRHVIYCSFPGYLSLAYPSDVEWYAH